MPEIRDIIYPKKVLIVDDDLELAKTYQIELEKAGFVTDVVFRWEEVVDEVLEKDSDLVFVDLMMPDRHGFKVLKNLKANNKTKNIPIIILTTLGHIDYIDRAIRLGAADYLLKTSVTPEKIKQIAWKYLISRTARYHDFIE
jgi:DNA-binding response OmpR family regulator